MQPYPHRYTASASGTAEGTVAVNSASLPELTTHSPAEFGGPGDRWSPETLLCASVADCFILTFRALARVGQLEWSQLECEVEAVLDRVERVTQMTHFTTRAMLRIPASADEHKARELLDRAEHRCLIANSLKGTRELVAEVVRV